MLQSASNDPWDDLCFFTSATNHRQLLLREEWSWTGSKQSFCPLEKLWLSHPLEKLWFNESWSFLWFLSLSFGLYEPGCCNRRLLSSDSFCSCSYNWQHGVAQRQFHMAAQNSPGLLEIAPVLPPLFSQRDKLKFTGLKCSQVRVISQIIVIIVCNLLSMIYLCITCGKLAWGCADIGTAHLQSLPLHPQLGPGGPVLGI